MKTPASRIVIIGGGMVGLTLAALLEPFLEEIIIIENQPAPTKTIPTQSPRVSAIHLAAQDILEKMGVWQKIPKAAQGMVERIHVRDEKTRAEIHFDFQMTETDRLATIIENNALVETLHEHLSSRPHVKFFHEIPPEKVEWLEDGVRLTLSNGTAFETPIIVGADGGNSWLRKQMQISVSQKSYDQEAFIALIRTEIPHQNKAFQIFLENGPLAFLPLAEASTHALIWTLSSHDAAHFRNDSPEVMTSRIHDASQNIFGKITLLSASKTIPLIARDAEHYVKPHAVLIGDAAHTIHPLAGQGVNLGLMDARCLSEYLICALNKKANLGAMRYLRAYERERGHRNRQMMRLMTILQMMFTSQLPGAATARRIGLSLLNHSDLLKQWIVRYATQT